jgi:hypothetical protein
MVFAVWYSLRKLCDTYIYTHIKICTADRDRIKQFPLRSAELLSLPFSKGDEITIRYMALISP